MNVIQTIQYEDGQIVPIVNQASHLGTTITAHGNYHAETKIAASMATLQRLNISWNKTPLPNKWKLRVYDAAIITNLLCGLESASLSNTDKENV